MSDLEKRIENLEQLVNMLFVCIGILAVVQ